MLGSIPDEGEEDQTNESGISAAVDDRGSYSPLGNVPFLGGFIDTSDQDIGAKGGNDGNDNEPDSSTVLIHVGDFFLFVALLLEQGSVRSKLEVQIGNVDGKEDDGCASGKDQETSERSIRWVGSAILEQVLQGLLGLGTDIAQLGSVV